MHGEDGVGLLKNAAGGARTGARCTTCMPHLGVQLAASGYPTFAAELLELHRLLRAFCKPPRANAWQRRPACLSCTLELELSYVRLRTTQPQLVWEISPKHGFSTLVILSALHRNNNSAHLHSFDIESGASTYVTADRFPHLVPLWTFHLADVRKRVEHLLQQPVAEEGAPIAAEADHGRLAWPLAPLAPRPQYVFLDSWHSEQMGGFYVDTLLPLIQQAHTWVSLHDVYNPLFWSDDHFVRDLKVFPPYLPNLEGAMVLDWLAYPHQADACNLFTAAPTQRGNAVHHARILRRRALAGLSRKHIFTDVEVYLNYSCPEPTIFFELGCRAAARWSRA